MARSTTPMQRGKALARGMKRLNPVSARRVKANVRRKVIAGPLYETDCAVKIAGGFTVPPCFGTASIHEPWTRARGGPIDDARNMIMVCIGHNEWLSQTVEGQRWGDANGLLISTSRGPAWLEAGGVLQEIDE